MTDPGLPGGPPQGGQPGAWGQPQPGFGQPGPFGPGQPGQPGPFGGPAPAPAGKPGKGRKIGSIAAAVAIAGGVAAFRLVDFGAPEVGDCITSEGTSYETIACDDSGAEARIVGVIDEQVTESEFYAPSYQPCGDFPTTTQVLWNGTNGGEGTVYCAEDV